MKRKRSWTSRNWAGLHGDVLGLILEKLFLLSDYIRFSVVCKSWNSIAMLYKENRIEQSKHQPPWLLRCFNAHQDYNRSLYNFMSGEICKFKLKSPDNQFKYLGVDSCHGWLFLKGTENSKTMVLNPLSGKVIELPPFDSSKITEKHWIELAGFSRDPSLGCFEAFVSSELYCAYIKFGDEYWTYSDQFEEEWDPMTNVAFFQGPRMLGITLFDRIIVSIDIISKHINHGDSPKKHCSGYLKISSNLKMSEILPPFEDPPSHDGFLVEAANGDLLVVYRHYYWDDLKTYKIYKLIIDSNGEFESIPLKTLGSECLFLADHQSGISIIASNHRGYTPNTIYNIVHVGGIYQIEVFSLEDGSFTRSCIPGYSKELHPVWMVPTMKL